MTQTNIAVFLTGLIIEKTSILPHIKRMFDYLASRNNLSVDFYCHFWDPSDRYPYNIDDSFLKIMVPWENMGSINYAIDVFRPTNYKISSYLSMHDSFVDAFHNMKSYTDEKWFQTIKYNLDHQFFFDKNIHNRFFVEHFPDEPEEKFDQWWYYHTKWCSFVHSASQGYSASNAMKLIANSDKHYDAIFKWRYDLLANYHDFENRIVETLHNAKNKNAYFTDVAWEGLEWSGPFPYNLNDDHSDKVVSVGDAWWITNHQTNSILSQNFYKNFINSMQFHNPNRPGGQHTWFYNAIRSSGVEIELVGKIQEAIIRFPETIPEDYHSDTSKYYPHLHTTNFVRKPHSDYRSSVSHWNKRSQYHTAKFFDFY
jgi:hypothetical protein